MTAWLAAPSSDCEALDPDGIVQDVNAWTSLAYVAAGLVLLDGVRRRRLVPVAGLLGVLAVLEGLGSLLFHGRPGTAAQWLHDVPFLGIVGVVAGWHAGRLGDRPARAAWVGGLGITVAAGLLHPVATGAVNAAAVVLVAAVAGTEALARRRGRGGLVDRATLGLLGAAVVTYLLGRTGGPACDPDSVVQWHGAWHVLTAVVIVRWGERALRAAGDRAGR